MTNRERSAAQDDDPAFRQAVINAWINNRMERDKSLMTLAASGIGLLVTLMTAVGVSSGWAALLYGLAMLAFVATIILTLTVFHKNADHLEKVANNEEADPSTLDKLDVAMIIAFCLGVLCSIGVGGVTAYDRQSANYQSQTKTQMKDDQSQQRRQSSQPSENGSPESGSSDGQKSVSGVSGLRSDNSDSSDSSQGDAGAEAPDDTPSNPESD